MVRSENAEHVMCRAPDFVFFQQPGQRTDQVARLLCLEEQVAHVVEIEALAALIDGYSIDQRKTLRRM